MSTAPEHQSHHDNHEDPSGMATWAVGIGGTFLVIATVAIAAGIFYSARDTEALSKNVNVVYEQRNMVRDAQQAVLEEATHVVVEKDAETGEETRRIVIPIDQAMDIIAGDTNK